MAKGVIIELVSKCVRGFLIYPNTIYIYIYGITVGQVFSGNEL